MSTETTFEDKAAFDEAIQSVRDDNSPMHYIVVGHIDNDPNRLTVLKVGEDVSDIEELLDDKQMMYALARYESTFDMSNTVKFVYFHWVGDQVSFVKKGRFGVVHGSVEDKFSPYHIFVETSTKEDFQNDKIMQKLEENTGKKSKVIETVTSQMQERGFTQTQFQAKASTAKSGPKIAKEGADIEISPEVFQAIQEVRSDESSTTWMLAQYEGGDPKSPLVLVTTGIEDINEMKSHLSDDLGMYALYRTTDKVDDIVTVKFTFIQWIGSQVKPMRKAKISTHKGVLEKTFGPYHVSLFGTDQTDISERIVMDKITSASGTRSHVK